MKEALQRFTAYATGSTSKERLLYRPIDNRLLCGSFNTRPRPELDEHPVQLCFASAVVEEAYCSASLERPRKLGRWPFRRVSAKRFLRIPIPRAAPSTEGALCYL